MDFALIYTPASLLHYNGHQLPGSLLINLAEISLSTARPRNNTADIAKNKPNRALCSARRAPNFFRILISRNPARAIILTMARRAGRAGALLYLTLIKSQPG